MRGGDLARHTSIFVIRTVIRIRWLSLDDYGFIRKSFKGKSANWIRNLGKRIVSLEQKKMPSRRGSLVARQPRERFLRKRGASHFAKLGGEGGGWNTLCLSRLPLRSGILFNNEITETRRTRLFN